MAEGIHPSSPDTFDWWSAQASQSPGLSGAEIAERHTLYPFFSALRVKGDLADRCDAIRSRHLSRKLRMPRELRFCDECVEADRLIGRPPYWRRSHQLPGTVYCHIHQVPLYQTCPGLRGAALYDIEAARETGSRIELEASESQRANIIGVARLTNWILKNRSAYCATFGQSRHFFEYIVPGQEIRRTSVSPNSARSRYIAHYGESFIDACSAMLGATNVRQVESSRLSRYIVDANMDLLLLHALLKQSWNMAWPKCLNTNADHGPDHRVNAVAKMRDRWAATCECGCTFEYVRLPIESGVRFEVLAVKLP